MCTFILNYIAKIYNSEFQNIAYISQNIFGLFSMENNKRKATCIRNAGLACFFVFFYSDPNVCKSMHYMYTICTSKCTCVRVYLHGIHGNA